MIQNPNLKAYRYDPCGKIITAEGYDTEKMKANRLAAIKTASSAQLFGIVLGTLGRQGSPLIFDRLRSLLKLPGRRCVLFLMAELNPAKIATISNIEAWVQVSCPRLSIDWGAGFVKVSVDIKISNIGIRPYILSSISCATACAHTLRA
jgi:2-(3-amino-3-carboxypropyl)histidine synthase